MFKFTNFLESFVLGSDKETEFSINLVKIRNINQEYCIIFLENLKLFLKALSKVKRAIKTETTHQTSI